MTKTNGPTLSDLLAQYGQLHDIRVASVQSDVDAESVDIHLEDLNNFHVGRPEYSGKQPAVLSFKGVEALALDFSFYDGVRISSADLSRSGDSSRLEITLNLGKGREIPRHCGLVIVFKECSIKVHP